MPITLIQNLIALFSAAMGAVLAVLIGVSHRHLCALISFAAGTLFATSFLHIIPEAVETLPWLQIFLAFASGYLLFYVISHYVFHVCPACAASHFDEQSSSPFKGIALLLAIALGIHSMMDGMAIAMGKELGHKSDLGIFLAITIHKFPEGLALCAFLLKVGFQKMKSVFVTLILESSTLMGWFVGVLLLRNFQVGGWFYLVLVHIGGGFIYLALHALLNESREHSPRFIIFFFLMGVAVMGLTRWVVP